MRLRLTLLLLHVFIFSTNSFSQSEGIDPRIEKAYWNFIRVKILHSNSYAARFETDIRVQLKGDITLEDSLCVQNLITDLKGLIKTVDIRLTDSIGNLILEIDNPNKKGALASSRFNCSKQGAIKIREYSFYISDDLDQDARNKTIKYYLFRGLTHKKHKPKGDAIIFGSIFQEKDPMSTGNMPVDLFIIEKLYSPDFYKQFKESFNKTFNGSPLEYIYYRYGNKVKLISEIIGFLIGLILFLILMRFKVLTLDNRKWKSFITQGMLIIQCVYIFYFIAQSFRPSLWFTWSKWLLIILIAEVIIFILLNGLFYLEQIVFKRQQKIHSRILIQFFSTSIFVYLFFLIFKTFQVLIITTTNKWIFEWDLSIEQIIIVFAASNLRVVFNYTNNRNIQELRKRDMELSQLKLLKNKAELQALHSRINPHFLYNSLNSIAALAHISPSKTEQMALALSDFFRYAINHKDQDMIELKKEVEITKTYLQIEKVRFGEDLDFTIAIDSSIESALIPRFLIQPLIENAVKHGVSVIQEKSIIKLEIKKQKDHLLVKVFDNGPDFPNMPISGYGLQSLYEKLEIIYGESAKISWENQPNKNICVRLPFTAKTV